MFKLSDKTTFIACNVKDRKIFGVDCPVAPFDVIYLIKDNTVVSREVETILIMMNKKKWLNYI